MNTAKKQHHVGPVHSSETKASKPTYTIEELQMQKAQIEGLKKAIGEKIKNPELAKKAALIISEMLSK